MNQAEEVKSIVCLNFALEIKFYCAQFSLGGSPVMANITRILGAANIRRQFFFVIATAASTR